MEPIVSGVADLSYLREALARAGAPSQNAIELVTDTLTDGRIGSDGNPPSGAGCRRAESKLRAQGSAVRELADGTRAGPYRGAPLVARRDADAPRRPALPHARCSEARHPRRVVDFMEDVSSGIVPRGTFDETRATRSCAASHACTRATGNVTRSCRRCPWPAWMRWPTPSQPCRVRRAGRYGSRALAREHGPGLLDRSRLPAGIAQQPKSRGR